MDKTASKLFNSASSKFSTLSTNKTFLYFTVFLAITTVIGYLATNRIRAVIFFALIGMLVSRYTPNMSVVLLIAVLSTSLLVSTRTLHEGMEDATSSTDTNTNADVEDKMTPQTKKALAALKAEPSVKDAKKKMAKETKLKEETTDTPAPEAMSSMPKAQNNPNKGASSRIDYASTIEEAYKNLEQGLGAGGIKQLTKDTSALMSQQKELFQSMQQMAPLIQDAKSMLKGFDMKSLNGLAGLATGVAPNPGFNTDSAPAPV